MINPLLKSSIANSNPLGRLCWTNFKYDISLTGEITLTGKLPFNTWIRPLDNCSKWKWKLCNLFKILEVNFSTALCIWAKFTTKEEVIFKALSDNSDSKVLNDWLTWSKVSLRNLLREISNSEITDADTEMNLVIFSWSLLFF